MDGTSRLSLPDGTTLQHALMTACFAERTVVSAAGAVPLPRELPLWQAALLGCGVVTGVRRRAATPQASSPASRRSSSGAAASGCRWSPRCGSRARRRSSPSTSTTQKLELARRARRDRDGRGWLGDHGGPRRTAHGRRRRPRLRGRRTPRDDAARVGLHPPRGNRGRRRARPARRRGLPPGASSSSPTRASAARTTGRETQPRDLPGSQRSHSPASSTSPASSPRVEPLDGGERGARPAAPRGRGAHRARRRRSARRHVRPLTATFTRISPNVG